MTVRIKTSFYSLDWEGHRYSNLQTETLDWKDMQEAKDCYALCKTEIVSMEALSEIPEKATCQNCKEGNEHMFLEYEEGTRDVSQPCRCCHGDYLNCPTCQTDEGKTTTQIAIESAKYNVEHATPENKAWAEKRLQEELGKASKL